LRAEATTAAASRPAVGEIETIGDLDRKT